VNKASRSAVGPSPLVRAGGAPRGARVGHLVRFTARPGCGEDLATELLDAIRALADEHPECELCVVTRAVEDADVVWVTEVWESVALHKAFAARDDVRAVMDRVRALSATPPERIDIVPLGGKGLAPAP
jgi:quinol monooxygenase YgiN